MRSELSIIIPCYNEAENIPILLEKFKQVISESKIKDIELILVDNNSKDNTKEVLKEILSKYKFAISVFQPIQGYGAAVYKGIELAKGEFICTTHADLQTDPFDVIKAYNLIKEQDNNKKGKP